MAFLLPFFNRSILNLLCVIVWLLWVVLLGCLCRPASSWVSLMRKRLGYLLQFRLGSNLVLVVAVFFHNYNSLMKDSSHYYYPLENSNFPYCFAKASHISINKLSLKSCQLGHLREQKLERVDGCQCSTRKQKLRWDSETRLVAY